MIVVNMSDQEAKAVLSLGSKIRRAQGLQEVHVSAEDAPKVREALKKPRKKERTVSRSAKKTANAVLNRKINAQKSQSTLALSRGEKEVAIEHLQAALDLTPENWNSVKDSIQRRLVKLA